MQHYRLESVHTGQTLYEGRFYSLVACLENAIANRINLNFVNLRNLNLSNANLDDGLLAHADFTNTNLSGANLSEATLSGALFNGAALYNTFLCESDLTRCDFKNASFGATDIHDADLSRSQFSTLSCFTLDFTRARSMNGCVFFNPDGKICKMSRPPIVIRGLMHDPIVLMDDTIKAGHNLLDHPKLEALGHKLYRRELRRRAGGS
jgi:hypothetical protein